eukprot:2520864-Alexandrium_andersonii.AAC.1
MVPLRTRAPMWPECPKRPTCPEFAKRPAGPAAARTFRMLGGAAGAPRGFPGAFGGFWACLVP